MGRIEDVTYLASAIGILDGANLDFDTESEAPCFVCGVAVNLDTAIPFAFVDEKTQHQEMKVIPERDARQLLALCGLDAGPILCIECGQAYGDSGNQEDPPD